MAENNATCSICGNGYHLCLSCRDAIQLAPYAVHCCSADCYKVFQVIRGFSTGVYTEEEFKNNLTEEIMEKDFAAKYEALNGSILSRIRLA